MAAILDASNEPIGWPDLPGWPYLEHLVQRAVTAVAVGRDDGVVGFGGAIEAGHDGAPARWLTDLFVHPENREAGAGRTLLDVLLDGADQRMTASTGDRRALSLYIRAGMRPWWPFLYLSGEAENLPEDETMTVERADVGTTAAWSQAWTGHDRTADFGHYASLPEARGFAVREAGAIAAVGWARRDRRSRGRWLDHVTIAPDADPVRAVLAAWRAAALDGGIVRGVVPGPHPAVATMLERGIRILDRDTFCATDPGLLDPVRILPNPGFL